MIHPGGPQMTIWLMRIAYWIPKAMNSHAEYVIRTAFRCNDGSTNAPKCYVIRTLPVLQVAVQA
jgi:hypothetical protein